MATEGGTTWLAVAALVAAILLFDAWVVLAGDSPGPVPGSLSEVAVRGFEGGQHAVFAPGRLKQGDVFSCTNSGLRVAARVPPPGETARQHVDATTRGGATITVATGRNGWVRVACRD
ncbi:MAG TPA: hypothetical protein VFJ77_05445 [Gaiellaceae bacterium]|nr:hypothetical protein [Gaiellaceae bacterium]